MTKANVKAVTKNTGKSSKKQQSSKVVSVVDLLKNLEKPMTQTQQLAYLSETTQLTKKDVASVIDGLIKIIGVHLKKIGLINLSGLMKIYLVKKPATKSREGINPLTGKPAIFKAKPARKVVRIRPLKKLKDLN